MQRDNASHQLQSHLALLHRAKERRRWSVASIPSSGYGTTTPASSNSQCSLNTDEHSNCSCAHHSHFSSQPHHSHSTNHATTSHGNASHTSSSSLQLHGKFLHIGLPYSLAHHFSSNDSNPCVEEELRLSGPTHFRPRSRSLSSPVRTPQVERVDLTSSAKNQLTLSAVGSIGATSMANMSPGTITFRRRSRSLSSPIRSPGVDSRFVQMSNVYRERFPNAIKQMQERLEKFVGENPELMPEIASDAVTRFVHHQVVEMAKDCLQKSKDDLISSQYFYEMSESLEKLLTECREKSSNAVLHLKKIIKKLLIIVSRPARLLECLEFNPDEFYRFLEVAEGQAKVVAGIKTDIPQYIIEKLGLTRDPLVELVQLSENLKLDETEQAANEQSKPISDPIKIPTEEEYETIKLISNGAYGAVYLVKHRESGQRFAMKKINKTNLVLRNQVEQAFAERDIMSFTDNPFVVSLFCSFETKKYLCMVMEYVEGGDCATLLKCMGPLPVDLARFYFAETVLAVEYLHSYGIVHRDLKPDNLLITGMGHIKLTDFGLSKIGLMNLATNLYEGFLDKETKQFNDKQVYGTPEYIAPEVILRQGYGKPVDWWSMGVILYEFLIGCVPFFGETPEELFAHVINDEIEWPDEKEWPLPDEAKCLISQFLVQNPIERLGTSGALEVKEHCFFAGIDWDALLRQKAEFIPQLNDPDDTSYFDTRTDRYNHEMQDSEDLEDTDESSLFSSFSSCSPRYHKVCSRTENQLIQETLMKSSSTSSILEDTNKTTSPSLQLGRNCLSQFECSSTSNLMRALSLNEPETPGSASATGSNSDLRQHLIQNSKGHTPVTATPDSSQTESEDYSPLVRRRRTLGAKDLPKFSIDKIESQKRDDTTDERKKSPNHTKRVATTSDSSDRDGNRRVCTPSIREIPPEDAQITANESTPFESSTETEPLDEKDTLSLDAQSRSVIKSASASGLSLLIPKLELLNRRCSGDLPSTQLAVKSNVIPNQSSNAVPTKISTKNQVGSVSEQNLSTTNQPKLHLRNTRPSLPGVYLISPSNSSTSSRDNSPNRYNRRRSSNQQRPTSGLATPPSAPVAHSVSGHPLENMCRTQTRSSHSSLLGQLKPPIILRKSSRGFGFTLKAIRVFFGDTDVYTVQHLVLAVETSSPAFEAGLKPGDLITHINGEVVQGLLHHQVLQLILSSGDRIQIQTMPLELSTIKTGGRKRNPQHSRFAKRSGRSQGIAHRRSGHLIGAAGSSAFLSTAGSSVSTGTGGGVLASPPIAGSVLRRNDSEKRRKSASLLRRLSSKRASAELNQYLGSQFGSQSSTGDPVNPITPSRSYQSLASPNNNANNIGNNHYGHELRSSGNSSAISPASTHRYQCTPVAPLRPTAQSQLRSLPSFSDSSQSSSPTSPIPSGSAGAGSSAAATIYSRPNSLHGLKHKLVQTFRSPRRKSCGHIPLSPLARSGAPNSSGSNSQMLSPTRSPSPLAIGSHSGSVPAHHSTTHPLLNSSYQSPRVHTVTGCCPPSTSTFHRSSPNSGRSTCSSSGEFEQPVTPPSFPEHPCKGRKYSSACCNCSPLALSSLPPSSGRSHFQCRLMMHQADGVPAVIDGRRSASPAAPITTHSVRHPLPSPANSESRHTFTSTAIDLQPKAPAFTYSAVRAPLKSGGNHSAKSINHTAQAGQQPNFCISKSCTATLPLSSSSSSAASISSSSPLPPLRQLASPSPTTLPVLSTSIAPSSSSSALESGIELSGAVSQPVPIEKDSESSCSSASDCSVRTARLPPSSSSRSLGSLVDSASTCKTKVTTLIDSVGNKSSTSNRSATTSKKTQMLHHQMSQPETTFARVRKSLGSPINIRKSLFKQTDKRSKSSTRNLKDT